MLGLDSTCCKTDGFVLHTPEVAVSDFERYAFEYIYSIAGVAQLGEQQTEELSILEVPCSIHGPGIFF